MRAKGWSSLLGIAVVGSTLSGCYRPRGGVVPGVSAGPDAAPLSSTYHFDGFRLGDFYGSEVMSREPYRRPCDNDPIDRRRRRFMVYGALPCRGRTFPESTTVAFFLRYARLYPYQQPIVAFAWMGGGYFDARSNFPVRVGEPQPRADQVFGAPVGSFRLGRWGRRLRRRLRRLLGLRRGSRRRPRRGRGLTVLRYRADIHALVDRGVLVGFVVGPMPEDPRSEQWRGLQQMYQRYTPKP